MRICKYIQAPLILGPGLRLMVVALYIICLYVPVTFSLCLPSLSLNMLANINVVDIEVRSFFPHTAALLIVWCIRKIVLQTLFAPSTHLCVSPLVSKMVQDPPELKVLFKCKLLFTISYAWYKFLGSFIFTLVCSSKSFHSYNLYAKIFPVLSHIFQYVWMKSE